MLDRITFNDILFSDYHTFYDGSKLFDTPEKDIEFFSVIGRNGDLSISNDRYNNLDITINCFIRENFVENYSNLMNILSSQVSYGRLETSKEPDIYRMAQFISSVQPEIGAFLKYGNFDLIFNCKPQKFLKSGETYISVTSSRTLTNPTLFSSKPLIKVSGTGSMTINEKTLTLQNNTSTTYIDCEIEDCYEGTINRNKDLLVPNGFPVLSPGSNNVSVSGCTIEIMPRWWKL